MPYASPAKASDWLAANHDRILEQKRQRYATDPAHAAEKRRKAIARYHEKKQKATTHKQ